MKTFKELQKEILLKELVDRRWNYSKTAKALKMSRATIRNILGSKAEVIESFRIPALEED